LEFVPSSDAVPGCELCSQSGGELVLASAEWRVIRVADADFPAFYRVVWRAHAAEFSDLPADARARCMAVVCCVEQVLRAQLSPTKINLASLGNMVPHVHWHVIARFDWDSHFPHPVWGLRQREVVPAAGVRLAVSIADLDAALKTALQSL
jgi:diadenosine tetraphosphate (Ap4A) HIT family hydrolase